MSARKVGSWLLVVFVIYTVVVSPDKAGSIVQGAFNGVSSAFHAIGRFLTKVTG